MSNDKIVPLTEISEAWVPTIIGLFAVIESLAANRECDEAEKEFRRIEKLGDTSLEYTSIDSYALELAKVDARLLRAKERRAAAIAAFGEAE